MKKVVIDKAGCYDVLKVKTFPNPKPAKGEILIEVRACGVNFADCLIRMGVYQSAKEFVGWPITPGFEVSGIVSEVGEGATRYSVGQKVVAFTLFGGYASHLVVPEDQAFPLPEGMDFVQGASFPTVFLTAYYALFELAYPREKDLLLVHSAAGGVGSTLVQFGKLAGCRVAAVVGASHKVDYVKSLGADVVIDKSKQNLWKEIDHYAPTGFDCILDANGAETLRQDYKRLSSGGKLVIYGFHSMFSKGRGTPNWFKLLWDYCRTPRFNPLSMTNKNRSVLAFNLSYLFQKKEVLQHDLLVMLRWLREGKVVLPAIRTYPLEQVAEAQRDLESGRTVGKLVLTIQ